MQEILGLRRADYREGGYTLEIVDVSFDDNGNIESYSNDGFEFLSKEFIDERNNVDFAENERDVWEEAVRGGYTDLGLEEWYENEINCNCCGLFPFDDDSYRDEAEELWEKLNKEDREALEEYVGIKGEMYEFGEDFVTFNWVHSMSLGNPEEQDDWVVVLNNDLLEKIVKYDAKYYTPETCPRCGKQVEHGTPMYWSHSSEFDGNPLCEACDRELDELEREQSDNTKKEENFDNFDIILNYFKHKFAEQNTLASMNEVRNVIEGLTKDLNSKTLKGLADNLRGIYSDEN